MAGHLQGIVQSVAKATGINETDIMDQLKAGNTLAQIIEVKGGKVDDVVDFLMAGEKAELSTKVSQKLITQEQMDQWLIQLHDRLARLLQLPWPGTHAQGQSQRGMTSQSHGSKGPTAGSSTPESGAFQHWPGMGGWHGGSDPVQ